MKRKLALYLVAAAVVTTVGLVRETKLTFARPKALGFESGDFSDWSLNRISSPDAASIVDSEARFGRYSAMIGLDPGAKYGDGFKSELSDEFRAPLGEEAFYRVSHFIPVEGSIEEGNPCVISNWHNSSPPGTVGGKPPLAHRLKDGSLQATVNYHLAPLEKSSDGTQVVIARIEPIPTGRWIDFAYHVRWAANETGFVRLWIDGKKAAEYRGPLGYPADVLGPYFKTGMYCARSPKSRLSMLVDEYRRGASWSEVLLPGESLEGVETP